MRFIVFILRKLYLGKRKCKDLGSNKRYEEVSSLTSIYILHILLRKHTIMLKGSSLVKSILPSCFTFVFVIIKQRKHDIFLIFHPYNCCMIKLSIRTRQFFKCFSSSTPRISCFYLYK